MGVDGEDDFFEGKNTRESSGMKVDEDHGPWIWHDRRWMMDEAKKKGCVALLRLFLVSLAGCYSWRNVAAFPEWIWVIIVDQSKSVLPQIRKHSHQRPETGTKAYQWIGTKTVIILERRLQRLSPVVYTWKTLIRSWVEKRRETKAADWEVWALWDHNPVN